MARLVFWNDSVVFMCEECGMLYSKKQLALQCERWCKEHKSCNLELTHFAVN